MDRVEQNIAESYDKNGEFDWEYYLNLARGKYNHAISMHKLSKASELSSRIYAEVLRRDTEKETLD